jgi:hypothetical protein
LIYTRFAPDKIHNTHPEWSTRITPALALFASFQLLFYLFQGSFYIKTHSLVQKILLLMVHF